MAGGASTKGEFIRLKIWGRTDKINQILSDVVESVLGALFVSEEFLEVGTDAFFNGSLKPFFDEHIRMQSLSHHPSVGLYEWFQGEGCQEHQIEKTSGKNGIRCEGMCISFSDETSHWIMNSSHRSRCYTGQCGGSSSYNSSEDGCVIRPRRTGRRSSFHD